MSRPPLEVADLIRVAGQKFIEASRRWITGQHLKVLAASQRCRTAALGGHRDRCSRCGYRAISFNSCRNRHCPKCQAQARDRWLEARRQELLPTRYVHVVFTLPHLLAPLALQNKKVIYDLLLRASAQTLLEVARHPRHLGAEIGFFSVLHTWNQKLEHHPHIHCVVPAGGLSPDHQHWLASRRRFFLPIPVLARVFRGKFVAALKWAFAQGQLSFHGELKLLASLKAFSSFLRPLFRQDWVVYCKPPFGGPAYVLHYLGAYTHRVAISNHRLASLTGDQVTFRWRDSAHANQQCLMTLSVEEFLRRFLLHLLPPGFVRIRHFGFLAHRHRARFLPLCFQLLGSATGSPLAPQPTPGNGEVPSTTPPSTSSCTCPQCGGPMIILERLTAVPDHPAFSTIFPRGGRMKRSLSFRECSPPSVPTLFVCLSGPAVHIYFFSIASYPGGPILKSPLRPPFAAMPTPLPPRPTLPPRTANTIQIPIGW